MNGIAEDCRPVTAFPYCPGCEYARRLESDLDVVRSGLETLRNELRRADTIREAHRCWDALFGEIEQTIGKLRTALLANDMMECQVVLTRFARCVELRDAATASGRVKALYLDSVDSNTPRP